MTSLSKKLCLRRNSFDSRVCDDLCEVLLQFLPLKDKLRLECVSKQFQRTVFQKQYGLSVGPYKGQLYIQNDLNGKGIESVLKKCPNVTSVDLCHPINRTNQLIQLITKYCNHLVYFNCDFEDINESVFEEFRQKFGSKLKVFGPKDQNLKHLNHFPNAEELFLYSNSTSIHLLSSLKLKKLEIFVYKPNQKILKLIENIKTLRYLNLYFNGIDRKAVDLVLKDVSEFQNLIHFGFYSRFGLNDKQFSDSLKQMTNNCLKLKSFRLVVSSSEDDLIQVLSPLKAFKALKRLNLKYNTHSVYGSHSIKEFSFSAFEGLPNITHLTLETKIYEKLSADLFKHIDIHLPNLQYLVIWNRNKTYSKGLSTPEDEIQISDILSRLSKLQTISLFRLKLFRFKANMRSIENQITEKCRKLKAIHIK